MKPCRVGWLIWPLESLLIFIYHVLSRGLGHEGLAGVQWAENRTGNWELGIPQDLTLRFPCLAFHPHSGCQGTTAAAAVAAQPHRKGAWSQLALQALEMQIFLFCPVHQPWCMEQIVQHPQETWKAHSELSLN